MCVKYADYLHRLSVKWVRGFDMRVKFADYHTDNLYDGCVNFLYVQNYLEIILKVLV